MVTAFTVQFAIKYQTATQTLIPGNSEILCVITSFNKQTITLFIVSNSRETFEQKVKSKQRNNGRWSTDIADLVPSAISSHFPYTLQGHYPCRLDSNYAIKNAIKLQADVSFGERCSNLCSDDTKGLVEPLETSVCAQNYSAAGSHHSQMVIVNLRELVVGQLLHKGQMLS